MKFLNLLLIYYLNYPDWTFGWNLEYWGINNRDFYVSDIAVFFNRAFLTIPRTVCKNNISNPTLVEVPWKEFNPSLSRVNKPIGGQIWAQCEDLQNAVALALEAPKPKLWILDKGNEFCPAKVVAYSLFQNDFLDQKIELTGVPKDYLNSMVIEDSNTFGDNRAFIGNSGENIILVCYLKDLQFKLIKIVEKTKQYSPLNLDFLTISKTTKEMYFTGKKSTEVFSLHLNSLPEIVLEDDLKNSRFMVNATLLGHKLGVSSGLETDYKNGLSYYLLRDYVVVRWIIGEPMDAEHHDVLAQSYKRMPYVSRLFTGPQNGIWALVNPFSPTECHVDDDSNTVTAQDKNLKRVVKIMKFNKFFDKFF